MTDTPEITMCTNSSCPLAKKCYRHVILPSSQKLFARFMPEIENGEVTCEMFMPKWGEYDD